MTENAVIVELIVLIEVMKQIVQVGSCSFPSHLHFLICYVFFNWLFAMLYHFHCSKFKYPKPNCLYIFLYFRTIFIFKVVFYCLFLVQNQKLASQTNLGAETEYVLNRTLNVIVDMIVGMDQTSLIVVCVIFHAVYFSFVILYYYFYYFVFMLHCTFFLLYRLCIFPMVLSEPKVCQTNEFRCGDGQCISNELHCNGRYDCRDGSDEINCGMCQNCQT